MTPEDTTIAGIAAGSPDFDILARALDAADLAGAVGDPAAQLTVFAPTDTAFARLARDLGYTGDPTDEDAVFAAIADSLSELSGDGDPIPLLADVLLYHVSEGVRSSEAVAAADTVPTLNGETIAPDGLRLVDREPDLLDPEVVEADIAASNGLVHAIDRVLLPLDAPGNDRETVAGIASTNDTFEVLTLALEAAGLTGALDGADDQLTVFAPTDAAFAALAADLGVTGDPEDPDAVFGAIADALSAVSDEGDPIPLLADVLLYHVAPGARTVAELSAAPQVTTLNGRPTIATESGLLDADPDLADAAFVDTLTDLPAANGLVQAVDRVLLPLDLPGAAPAATIADLVAASGDGFDADPNDFDLLLAAVQTADLTGALADPAATLTVAAPTDAAFVELAVTFGASSATEAEAFDAIVQTLTALSADADPVPLLTEVLLYHVYEGAFPRVALAEGPALTSLLGPAPQVDAAGFADADTDVADARFLDAASDIAADNGLIQAIDRVLLPLDVQEAIGSGREGDDTITVGPATTAVMGGAGTDRAVFTDSLAAAEIDDIAGGFRVTLGDRAVSLMEVETLQFADATLEVDTSGTGAQAARLFEAGFGREGAPAGLSFLAGIIEDKGLDAAADTVVASPEFEAQFGADPTHGEYVDALFVNVLGREARPDGREFWTGVLSTEGFGVPDLLLFFSESPEYRAQLSGTTDDGVLLLA